MSAIVAPSPTAILERVVKPMGSKMSPQIAEALLNLKFSASDLRRLNSLLQATKDETLTAEQEIELESYRTVGRMIDLMRIQARQALKQKQSRQKK